MKEDEIIKVERSEKERKKERLRIVNESESNEGQVLLAKVRNFFEAYIVQGLKFFIAGFGAPLQLGHLPGHEA